jgi:hypothetical protein
MASDGLTNAMLDALVRDGRRQTDGGRSPGPGNEVVANDRTARRCRAPLIGGRSVADRTCMACSGARRWIDRERR